MPTSSPAPAGPAAARRYGGQPSGTGTYAIPFFGSGYRINNNLNIWIAELNTRFGNSASNKLQVGYTRERDFRVPQSSNANFPLVDILSSNNNIVTTFGYRALHLQQHPEHGLLPADGYLQPV